MPQPILALTGVGVVLSALVVAPQRATQAPTPSPTTSPAAAANCVTITPPSPSKVYTYRHEDPSGSTTNTQQWESITATGSRVRANGPAGTEILTHTYRIVDDVAHISKTVKTNGKGAMLSTTSFSPGVVSDPTFRACAGRSWTIPSVQATFTSGTGQSASATAQGGSLMIIAIREKITVPAGTFETVHYMRRTQSADEYWKSIDQGVVVQHISTVKGGRVVETLISVK